jgi:hypothetical protein
VTAAAQAIAQVLLDHHRSLGDPPPNRPDNLNPFTIRYGTLCERAGVPWLTRSVGRPLQEIAEWCVDSGWPPINSLAVNDTGMPGGGYDGAPECDLLHWPDQAWDCIVFEDYPTTVS